MTDQFKDDVARDLYMLDVLESLLRSYRYMEVKGVRPQVHIVTFSASDAQRFTSLAVNAIGHLAARMDFDESWLAREFEDMKESIRVEARPLDHPSTRQ